MVLHYWKAQRRLSLAPNDLKHLFTYLPGNRRFDDMHAISEEIVNLFSWLQPNSIQELDLRGVKIVNWKLFQGIVEDQYGPGVMASVLNKTTKLHLEGCLLHSDDIYNAANVLSGLEIVTISDKTFTIYDEAENEVPEMEIKGKVKKKRLALARLLYQNFPQLRIIKFY